MDTHRAPPRWRVASVAACLAVACFACSKKAPPNGGASKAPLTINLTDVGGGLQLVQEALERYRTKHPDAIAKFTFTKAPAPELPGKLMAMQAAGRSDIDLVLGGTDILASGNDQRLWLNLLPDHADKFQNVLDNYLPNAKEMQKLAQGNALAVVFMPSGPLLEYNPAKVDKPPTTPAELLAWAKAHPKRFTYARPRNSGPGRTFMMGLPYLLGDKNPKDPVKGWDRTWAYLKELGNYIEYYPTGTGALMKELGEGSRDMTVTVTGWDINPRAMGIVPKEYRVAPFDNMTWVNDSQYFMVPKGVAPDNLAVVLDVIKFALEPEQQALTWDKGYFYPGPAVKDVPLSMAPLVSQHTINEFGRAEYQAWIDKFPHTQPLENKPMVAAYQKWDAEIGDQKLK